MYKIATLNKISPLGLELFDKTRYTYGDDLAGADAVMVRSASLHETEFPDTLKAIARAGAGVNNIPVDQCSQQGVVVFNTPGANANAVKELVLTGLLLSSRKILPAINWAKTLKGQGAEVGKLVEKGKGAFGGPEITGKKLGVIGLGAIGILVANAAHSLGMDVYGYDPYLSINAAWGLSRSIHRAQTLKDIYTQCDYISIHVPSTPETREMIHADAIALMKDGVRILNFSRAELVSTPDIIAALEKGKVSAYVTDFPTEEVLNLEGIIAIPHLGASTPESEDNCATMAASELIDFLEHGNIRNSVNFPDVSADQSAAVRVCIIHKNIPNILSSISSLFSAEHVNIENMLNKSKKDYAYTICDVATINDGIIDGIKKIDGVLRVQVIR